MVLVDNNSFSKQNVFYSYDNSIEVWKGDEVTKKDITKKNNCGLILKFNLGEKFLLLGDCENTVVPNVLYNESYGYIVISHHGSYMSKPQFKSTSANKCAYVSYGNIRGNCSLNPDLEKEYNAINYRLKKTCDLDCDKYTIHLSSK